MESVLVLAVIVLVAWVAMAVWARAKRARHGFDPGSTPPRKRGMPEDRPTTWDPRERYE